MLISLRHFYIKYMHTLGRVRKAGCRAQMLQRAESDLHQILSIHFRATFQIL